MECEEILREFLLLPRLLETSSIKYVPFFNAVQAIGAFYGPPNSFKATGRFVYKNLSLKNIRDLINFLDNSPGEAGCYIRVYSLGGTIKNFPNNYSAYYYRNAEYILGITADWEKGENPDIYKMWVQEVFNYVKPITNGSYVNFPYNRLED